MAVLRLEDVIEQPAAIAFLKGVVRSGRPGGAYLFAGPAGTGKGTAALAFARALLCERVPGGRAAGPGLFDAEEAGETRDDACGTCGSCLRSGDLQHPDLQFLFPVAGEERELDETIAETLRMVREEPFPLFVYEKASSIRLSITRDLLRTLAFEPFEAARRVVVVRDADRMREDQYSALLKTLEEPGRSTVWVLTTSRPFRLPATIRSRCQRVRFSALPEPAVASFLTERASVPGDDATLLAALAGGSLGRALILRDTEPARKRDEARALLEPARRGDAAGLWASCQRVANYGKAGRETLRRMIESHQLWLRDLARVRAGLPREALANRDREADLKREAETLSAREIRRRLLVLEEALQSIEGNVSADLTLFSAMTRLAGARFGEHAWPAHPTGRWDY